MDKDYGNSELMSEAARDIQNILDGKFVKPNKAANAAYAQKILDWTTDNEENISQEDANNLFAYIDSLFPIIQDNMHNSINEQLAAE